jgi:hypothetical protein
VYASNSKRFSEVGSVGRDGRLQVQSGLWQGAAAVPKMPEPAKATDTTIHSSSLVEAT